MADIESVADDEAALDAFLAERIKNLDSQPGLVAALARCQGKFPTILKGHTNPHYKSKYADLSDVLAAVRPVLSSEGIAIIQPIRTLPDGQVLLSTVLMGHGDELSSSLPLYLADMTPQQLGSTLTYYRRYMLASMLGVAADDDDDGNAAQTAPQPRSEPATVAPDMSKPLASMSIAELRGAAKEMGHDFGNGAITKAEMIRQLEPLMRALSGAEPFDITTNAPTNEGAAVDPSLVTERSVDELRLYPPSARTSVRRGSE